MFLKQLYQSLSKKPKKEAKLGKYIQAKDMMDIHSKDKHEIESFSNINSEETMLTRMNYESSGEEKSLAGQHSQKFFMMYASENGDGTTTSVAFGGVSTNVTNQNRTIVTRNIVTNSSQSMIAGTQR